VAFECFTELKEAVAYVLHCMLSCSLLGEGRVLELSGNVFLYIHLLEILLYQTTVDD
jgi:hypothetical protein